MKLFLFFGTLILLAGRLHADGMVYVDYTDESQMKPATELEQRGAIFMDQGREKLVISVDFIAATAESAVWMFPVPGSTGEVHCEISDQFPRFSGENMFPLTSQSFLETFTIFRFPQLITYPEILYGILDLTLGIEDSAPEHGFDSLQLVKKYGMHLELVRSDDADGLAAFFRMRGKPAPENLEKSFKDYFGSRFVFVVCWIDSIETLRKNFSGQQVEPAGGKRTPCIEVVFPARRPYFPLKPTSAYGNMEIPVVLYVQGAYFINRFDWWSRDAHLEYFCAPGFNPFRGIYTRCRLNLPAEKYRHDLEFTRVSFLFFAKSFLNRFFDSWLCLFSCYLLISYLAAGWAGMLLKKSFWETCSIGLSNFLGIPGMYMAARWLKLDRPENRISVRRWTAGIAVYALIFSFLTHDAFLLGTAGSDFSLPMPVRLFGQYPLLTLFLFLAVMIMGIIDRKNISYNYSLAFLVLWFLVIATVITTSEMIMHMSSAYQESLAVFLTLAWVVPIMHIYALALKNRFVLYFSLIFLVMTFLLQVAAGYVMFAE
ncbi:MAG: hypothetical protein PHQ23_15250 [Candidatus Wallbacteria bacterium]|nr:hypothetical protein [Candidatus Wallbacteria bacterium]